ncbi:MAG: hypothetical protein LBI87_08395 [Candidatus Accumulibacter sp.]|jgi:hypothetical protein|nr:hypothetical protein [Accumulibacter sp.]
MDRREGRRLEFPLLAAAIGLLAWLLLGRLDEARASFEEATVRLETTTLRKELLDRLAHQQAVGDAPPDSANPVVWTGNAPANYRGELARPPEETAVWYFDTRRRELVYRFRSGREARFRLARGPETANAPASLAGIGLLKVEEKDGER